MPRAVIPTIVAIAVCTAATHADAVIRRGAASVLTGEVIAIDDGGVLIESSTGAEPKLLCTWSTRIMAPPSSSATFPP